MPARSTRRWVLGFSVALAGVLTVGTAQAETPAPGLPAIPAEGLALQLEVFRNGEPSGLVAAFRLAPDGEVSADAAEIRALGLVAPPREGAIRLHDLAGVDYRYDEAGQRLFIDAQSAAIAPSVISLRPAQQRIAPSRDWGGLVNYSLALSSGSERGRWRPRLTGGTGAFDGRLFGPIGLLNASAAVALTDRGSRAVRLDTTWTRADPGAVLAWRAGDFVSGGLAWSRPLRLGGIQVGRDFSTRPDIVTAPTPDLSISAAAPSTLDVMLGSSVLLSRRVSAGPIQVTDLPTHGQGEARLVLRDAFGAEQVVSASYFATPHLLRRGLVDFSGEAGFARRSFGVRSADYDGAPVASGTVRFGASDTLTLQGHAEGGAGVALAGGGAVKRFGSTGVVSASAAASTGDGRSGALASVAFDGRVGPVSLSGQAQRTFGAYRDLAAATARLGADPRAQRLAEAPRETVQIAASTPLNLAVLKRWGDLPAVAITYASSRDRMGARRSVLSGTLQYSLEGGVSLQLAGYASRAARSDHGAFIAITAPLGGGRTATAGVDRSGGRASGFAEVRKQEALEPGSFGWRVRVDQGDRSGLGVEAVYRAPFARLSGRALRAGGVSEVEARADGALVWLGRPYLAGERLEGAFAAVDVGAPDVKVSFQNRPMGRSGADGRLLVPRLNAYEANLLTIDAADLPLSLTAPATRHVVSPPAGAGARVAFGVRAATRQAIVALRLANGGPPPAGAMASIGGGPFDQVVGYDGQLFLADAAASNRIQVDLGDGASCAAVVTLDNPDTTGGPHAATALCR